MGTMDNLQEAFAGESQANRKYTAFASKADEEGHPGVARLFRAAGEAETIHAMLHFAAMGKIGSTEENLKAAIEGESYEFESMYPPFLEQAKADGNQAAVIAFYRANEVEKIHAELYKKALADPQSIADTTFYVCQVCGNTVEDEAPEKCPVCGTPREGFRRID